jgi:hypothetical protein
LVFEEPVVCAKDPKRDGIECIIEREFILSFIRERGDYGATCGEIEGWFKFSGEVVRMRVRELLGEVEGFREIRIKRGTARLEAGGSQNVFIANATGV